MNRSILPRMIALVVVIVVGVWYVSFDVLNVHIDAHTLTVTVEMPSAGGLYAGADVTYRGVQIGTVTALDLSASQVTVRLGIDYGPTIPDNGDFYVKQLSALGEQYIDIQPDSSSGPYLENGTVIPSSRVVLPTPIGETLVDLGAMLRSINPTNVQTVEHFLATAFIGTGPGLRNIIVTGQQLFDALLAAQPETVNLVVDGRTDLQTLEATDGDFATFTQGLASLTTTLRNSNSDLRALIDNGAAAAEELNPFLSANSADIEALITNLATDAEVTNSYSPQVAAIFELLPYVSDDLASVAAGGEVHGVLELNTADTVCPYIPGVDMPGPTEKVSTLSLDNTCSSSASDMLQRGAGSNPSYSG
jgi:phospholipid/cholesterol/gamma-HCH transport system substrate-binding protein